VLARQAAEDRWEGVMALAAPKRWAVSVAQLMTLPAGFR